MNLQTFVLQASSTFVKSLTFVFNADLRGGNSPGLSEIRHVAAIYKNKKSVGLISYKSISVLTTQQVFLKKE